MRAISVCVWRSRLRLPIFRSLYEIRERPSRMYTWSALMTSLILVELPFNIIGSSLFYFTWYWTVGFDTSRAGYMFLSEWLSLGWASRR